jgi:nucleotide-binding universal stress UspA family protein
VPSGMKRILFATDFSACAQHAEAYAALLAERYDAALDVLHVIELNPGMDPEFPVNVLYLKDLQAQADSQFASTLERLRQRKLAVAEHRAVGMPSAQIASMASKYGSDLIVVGTHGRSGLEHILLGSTAERVVTMAPCPVLTVRLAVSVPPAPPLINIASLLVPIDFSDCSLDALEYATEVAKQFSASLRILHVLEPASYGIDFTTSNSAERDRIRDRVHSNMERLVPAIRPTGLTVDTAQRGGIPWESILLTAQESMSDLIVMGTHGRRGISHIVKGSVAEAVLRRSACPVLTVKSPKFAPGHQRIVARAADALHAT